MRFSLLLLAFVAERAHQWQSLTSRDWSVSFRGREVPRRVIVWTAVAIGWGEGLAFFITSEKTFWSFILWSYAGHALLTCGLLGWRRPNVIRFGTIAAGLVAAWLIGAVDSPASIMAAALALHAIPCFVVNLLRVPREARPRTAALGIGLALAEWLLVAKSVWFEDGAPYADLVDWWDLGPGANFWLLPLWMAPFLAHVVIDAIRYAAPPERAPA